MSRSGGLWGPGGQHQHDVGGHESPYSTALVSVSVRFSAISGGAAGGDISLAAGWLDLLLMGPGALAQDTPEDIAKKDLPKKATCVVCASNGEGHGEEKPAAGVRYKGKSYFFCNAREAVTFKQDPEAFMPPVLPRPRTTLPAERPPARRYETRTPATWNHRPNRRNQPSTSPLRHERLAPARPGLNADSLAVKQAPGW